MTDDLVARLQLLLAQDNGHCGESTSEVIARERAQQPIRDAIAELTRLQALVQEAGEVVGPFAFLAQFIPKGIEDENDFCHWVGELIGGDDHHVTTTDLRRAASFLTRVRGEGDSSARPLDATEQRLFASAQRRGTRPAVCSSDLATPGQDGTVYEFDRYVDGVRMAEGARISTAVSLADAHERARALFRGSPKSVFVLTASNPPDSGGKESTLREQSAPPSDEGSR